MNSKTIKNSKINGKVYKLAPRSVAEKISEYYEEHDNFQFLQTIINFMIETIEYIDDKYFILPKEKINHYIYQAKKIWENDGNAEKLNQLNKLFTKDLTANKPFKEILNNKEERSAMNCVLGILSNGHDDPTNQFVYDFIELHIADLEILNIEENIINNLLEKYFSEAITDNKAVEKKR